MWESSNPALNNDDAFQQMYGGIDGEGRPITRPATATVSGVVNKTAILVLITAAAGAVAYMFLPTTYPVLLVSALASMILGIGAYFLLAGKPQLSPVVGPLYAIVEGAFLGTLTSLLDQILINQGVAVPGLALQAVLITVSMTLAMLGLYAARIIKPTKTFQAVVGTLVFGIFVTYMLSWVLLLFGRELPFVSLGSALQGGTAAWIGLGLNALFLVVAALTLILDFKLVEDRVAAGSPKYMEWYCGFALLVTIAWIYYESVKLAFRVQMLLRD